MSTGYIRLHCARSRRKCSVLPALVWVFSSAMGCQTATDSGNKQHPNTIDASNAPSEMNEPSHLVALDAQADGYDADQLARCVRAINLEQDELHAEMTPSVSCLIKIGSPAIPPLNDLLDAPSAATRLHAVTALRAISRVEFGFDGEQWTRDDGQTRWMVWWSSIGYDYRAPAPARAASVQKLRAYYAPAANSIQSSR